MYVVEKNSYCSVWRQSVGITGMKHLHELRDKNFGFFFNAVTLAHIVTTRALSDSQGI